MEVENQIKKKVSQFSDWIHFHSIVKNYYIKDSQNWEALAASLLILKDLQQPKKEYFDLKSINHLEAIGIVQTLYIEQDSMQTLRNAILEEKYKGFKLNKYDKVRDIRNKIFGHPSDKSYKNPSKIKTRHFFDIKDSKTQTIKHIYWGVKTGNENREFTILELVMENSKSTLTYLEEIEQEFKNKFKKIMDNYTIKFNNLFRGSGYTFDKLLSKENDDVVIESYEQDINDEIKKIKKGLAERNILEDFKRDIEVLEFLSGKLKPLFYIQTHKDIEFYTYATTLWANIDEITKKLKAIDKL